ncbi:hypothetical protein SARC_01461 [Sphaeroforma arctica JP610]|uniref:NAD(+) diphosphatase n=1 Tax=Sphaeroforma arctica JP610 TaxID=667725 RepID=A0A0L0GBZ0_9EUKA|nr:hypothetical protein SARC_01461 [Sphaeroforma arctica JP610]KNC86411.1 hypothetical protein SARC_01461 [Sphaeroforma arctica JP610]|eukprot:XP_014160313.1 hypothetical protein SARC_01461 [Sphaeroforma arctica JP610]
MRVNLLCARPNLIFGNRGINTWSLRRSPTAAIANSFTQPTALSFKMDAKTEKPSHHFHRELSNVFAQSPLDRLNNHRANGSKFFIPRQTSDDFALLLFRDRKPLLRTTTKQEDGKDKKSTQLFWLTGAQYDAMAAKMGWVSRSVSGEDLLFLGEWDQQRNGSNGSNQCFTLKVESTIEEEAIFSAIVESSTEKLDAESLKFTNLRDVTVIRNHLSPEDGAVAAHAQALLHFHASHAYCGTCGQPTHSYEGGSKRICSRNTKARSKYDELNELGEGDTTKALCRGEWFPRTDPVVICIVIDLEREMCMLGRQAVWPKGMYSALAGFMEHGESIEDACRRELGEEAGVMIDTVRYHSSQPWPYPYSLMIGCIGIGDSTLPVTVDTNELEDARWFDRQQVHDLVYMGKTRKEEVDGESMTRYFMPPSGAIAYHLVKGALDVWDQHKGAIKVPDAHLEAKE